MHIEASPDRPKIFFNAVPRPNRGDDKLQPILCPLIEELKTFGIPSDNNLCNLRVIGECFSLVSEMMGLLHELVGSCQDAVYKLFTQLHANYPKHERERIVQDLVSGKSKLRLSLHS